MTKVFYLLCIALISIIVLLMYLKPDQHKSIAALQVEALTQAKSEQHPLRTATQLDHRDQPYLVVLNQIQKYIDQAPFQQQETRSILAANPPAVQIYLIGFDQLLTQQVLGNTAFTQQQKSELLWYLYKDSTWLGEDNAFQAMVKTQLMYLRDVALIPELAQTYQDLSMLGAKSLNQRHDLLEIISSIEIDPSNPNNALIIDTLRSELHRLHSRAEAQALADLVVRLMLQYADASEIDAVPDIIQVANQHPQTRLALINATFKHALAENNPTLLHSLINSQMNPATRAELNDVISFNLNQSGDLNNINPPSQQLLSDYIRLKSSDHHQLQNDINGKNLENKRDSK